MQIYNGILSLLQSTKVTVRVNNLRAANRFEPLNLSRVAVSRLLCENCDTVRTQAVLAFLGSPRERATRKPRCRGIRCRFDRKRKMIKTMCCLGSATLSVVLLSACGSTTSITLDTSKLSTGDTNALTSGGYWWTYTDHNAQTKSGHTGATIQPQTDLTHGLVPEVDSDAAHGNVIRFHGDVAPAPAWTDVTNVPVAPATAWFDTYWPTLYPKALIAAFPAAGAGFGFQKNNHPYDVVQGKYIGFIFDMKTTGNTNDVSVSVPVVGTDLADSTFSDEFPADGCIYPNKADSTLTDQANFLATNPTQTCFLNYRKLFPVASRAGNDIWQTYCVLWSELVSPTWKGALSTPPPLNHATLKQALKVQWDMFQPAATPGGQTPTNVSFDVKLDNIQLMTEADARKNPACSAAATGDAGVDPITASAALIAAP